MITGTLGSALMGYWQDLSRKRNWLIAVILFGDLGIPYWKNTLMICWRAMWQSQNIGGAVELLVLQGKFLNILQIIRGLYWYYRSCHSKDRTYKQKGSSGVGVRLLYSFAKWFTWIMLSWIVYLFHKTFLSFSSIIVIIVDAVIFLAVFFYSFLQEAEANWKQNAPSAITLLWWRSIRTHHIADTWYQFQIPNLREKYAKPGPAAILEWSMAKTTARK